MVKFLSDEWIEKAINIVNEQLDPKKDLENATASLLNIVTNIPPNGEKRYFYINVENGKIKKMQIDKKNPYNEEDVEFIVTGNYETFVQIFKGEMNTLVAIIKNRFRIKGDKIKAMKFIKPIDRLNECLRKINTEY